MNYVSRTRTVQLQVMQVNDLFKFIFAFLQIILKLGRITNRQKSFDCLYFLENWFEL